MLSYFKQILYLQHNLSIDRELLDDMRQEVESSRAKSGILMVVLRETRPGEQHEDAQSTALFSEQQKWKGSREEAL